MNFFTSLFILTVSLSAAADFGCTINQVLDDGDFENINDFTFEDAPYVLLKSKTEYGKRMSVGGMVFEERDPFQASVIKVRQTATKLTATAIPEESGQEFAVIINLKTTAKVNGQLFYTESGEKSLVADLKCLLN